MADTVVVKVNGEEIRLNAFVQRAFLGVLEGFLGSLDDVPAQIREITVSIKR
jgi:hypothetical protein